MRVYLAEKKQQGEVIATFLDNNLNIKRHDNVKSYKLSNGDVVCWCQGHLFGLAMPDYYSEDLKTWKLETLPFRPAKWALKITPAGSKLMPTIISELDNADEVVLCSDFDREGQYLGLNAIKEAGFKGRILRAPIKALDKVGLQRAFDDIADISQTMCLYYSAVARSHSDYLVGINLTRFFTCLGSHAHYKEKVNVGRVLTPTINLVVTREHEIENFKSKNYYELKVGLTVQKGNFTATWIPHKENTDAQGYVTDLNVINSTEIKVKGRHFVIVSVDNKTITQQPPLPFSLSTLQVYCGNHFKMTPATVLKIAQKLYDEQYTSYPRSDCNYLPESQLADAPLILEQLAKDYDFMQVVEGCDTRIKSHAFNDKKMKNSSHNAIIPTFEAKDVTKLTQEEFKVYDAIRRRYVAQFYIPAEFDAVQVVAECNNDFFKATGRTLKKAGYRMIYAEDLLDDSKEEKEQCMLPAMIAGEKAIPSKTEILSKKTRAPKRFTQHSLADTMEHIDSVVEDKALKETLKQTKGIGTVATRANIIDNLFDYGWVTQDKSGYLYATQKACEIMTVIPKDLRSPVMTAMWENELEKIADGKANYANFEDKIFEWVSKLIQACSAQNVSDIIAQRFAAIVIQTQKSDATTTEKCPLCHSDLKQITSSKTQKKYWVCVNKATCNFITNDVLGTPEIELCPKCLHLLKHCKYKEGKDHFWKCTNVSCGEFYKDIGGKPLFSIPPCPKCGKQMLFAGNYDREGRKQNPYFYCSGYRDKSCYCKLDKRFKEILLKKTK